ncbi:MAG: hypothetical protein WD403_11685 [Pirellulales bacterium]
MGAQTNPASSRSGQLAAWHRWSPGRRAVVSALLAAHLLAVLVGPWSRSILSDFLRGVYRPYLQAAYLDHGYKFFAPDPGPSHLIRYELEFGDGRRVEGMMPDRREHWPRLLYHRHFMLTETIPSPLLSPVWNPDAPWEEQTLSAPQQAYVRAYAAHLLEQYGAERVTLHLIQHRLADPPEVLDGIKLDDSSLYLTRPLGSFTRSPQ